MPVIKSTKTHQYPSGTTLISLLKADRFTSPTIVGNFKLNSIQVGNLASYPVIASLGPSSNRPNPTNTSQVPFVHPLKVDRSTPPTIVGDLELNSIQVGNLADHPVIVSLGPSSNRPNHTNTSKVPFIHPLHADCSTPPTIVGDFKLNSIQVGNLA